MGLSHPSSLNFNCSLLEQFEPKQKSEFYTACKEVFGNRHTLLKIPKICIF